MKLRQTPRNIMETLLDDMEYKVAQMEQKPYLTKELVKDLKGIKTMITLMREEIKSK
jgi:hypothetical protein|tara:strand:+ start:256 stop:426 length:171 start_codon:yes stop_codon:yes gene_type:complete